MDPSESMVGMKDDEGLVTEEDKDSENTKLSLVDGGNIDPENNFNSLVEFI